MLLTVMLESGCVTFLLSCVSAFCKVPAGLILMTTWAFSTVSKIKATLDSHNDILFDSGGLELADSQRQMFELNINMLESVALVFRHCLSIAEQLDLRETFVADLSHRMATISLILEYARLVLWLISQNLLPAADDGKAFGQNSRIERLISDRRGQKTLANFLLETVAMPIAEFWTSEHSWNQILPPPSYSVRSSGALCCYFSLNKMIFSGLVRRLSH